MKTKVFISFAFDDKAIMERLKKQILKSKILTPIVITDRRESGNYNSDKIIKGLKESDLFVPIITSNSLNNQWVNQEIGYAKSLNLPFYPLIEKPCLDKLKGFINKEIDQPYQFMKTVNQKSGRKNFRECYKSLLQDIEEKYSIIILEKLKNEGIDYLKGGKLVKINDNSRSLVVGDKIHHLQDRDSYNYLKSLPVKSDDKVVTSIYNKVLEGRPIRMK